MICTFELLKLINQHKIMQIKHVMYDPAKSPVRFIGLNDSGCGAASIAPNDMWYALTVYSLNQTTKFKKLLTVQDAYKLLRSL